VHCAPQNVMTEFSLRSGKGYDDPFNDVEVDVVFTDPDGCEKVVPAFWAGGDVWRVRYASHVLGRHNCRSICSDTTNLDLHGRESTVEIRRYKGDNPLYKHGPLRVSDDRRHLEHRDGTPFFWLGDTWWMGLCKRLKWPGDFQRLTADRVQKGYTVIQIVAGLYPDMGAFDERGANEAGFPWEKDWKRIRPAYFDAADLRMNWLVERGLVPCIVGCWGYYMDFCGPDVLKKHWRYIVGRWGAYPVVWCIAGEVLMLWYLRKFANSIEREAFVKKTREDWMDVTRYLRMIDPWAHPITAHPGGRGSREMLGDELVDIEMLQTGHSGHQSIPNTIRQITESVAQEPRMPVINGEVSYEGICGTCWSDVQRFMFWTCMLCGAAGHTYGANGVWQMDTKEEPYGASPHGRTWGVTPWEEAYRLVGSAEVGLGKRLLERYEWWRMRPTPDAVEPRWTHENYYGPYAATIPDRCVIIYIPSTWSPLKVKLERGKKYRAFFFDPSLGTEYNAGPVATEDDGSWTSPVPPLVRDMVLVVERVKT
jgi:hypothetical protein